MKDKLIHPEAKALRALSLPDVVPLARLAEHLGLSPATVRTHLRRGQIPGRKVGGRWFVTRRDFLAFLEARPPRSIWSRGGGSR